MSLNINTQLLTEKEIPKVLSILVKYRLLSGVIGRHNKYYYSSTFTLFVTDSPIIITDPQSKYRSEGDSLKLCCQTEPAVGVTYKW